MVVTWSSRVFFLRSPLWGLLCAIVLSASLSCACSKKSPSRQTVRPVFCYSSMERNAPGVLHLSKTVDCSVGTKHYRAQGPRDKPDMVDLIDDKGEVLISYHLDFDEHGRTIREIRIFKEKPRGLNIYEMGNRYEFSSKNGDKWHQVSIVTDLDEKGRPVKVTKKVADEVEYSMERKYGDTGLVRETVLGPDGKIRLQSEFKKDGKSVVEVMRDQNGKTILKRKIPATGKSYP